jgi:UDP-N-acetyl-D-glucosamine dehydrogenase
MKFSTRAIPKVIGGDGKDAAAIADALYSTFVPNTVPVSSPETAEAVKLTENIFRSLNIALVNELKVVYAAMGIDVWEVIDLRRPLHPHRSLLPHLEGARIRAFHALHRARRRDQYRDAALCRVAIADELDARAGKGLNGAKILILGLALQEERRRHPRKPGIQAHRAAGKARCGLRCP